LDSYEKYADPPLLFLALAIVPLIVVPLTLDLSPAVEDSLFAVDWLIWGVFAADLGVRTYLAPDRRQYLTSHWYDVLVVAIPFLRPLRVLRSVRLIRLARLTWAASLVTKIGATALRVGRRNGLGVVLGVSLVLLFVAAALVFAFERNGDGSIDNFGTALWWAVTTITTVGYGDTFPVTNEGRVIAVFLMILGITLFGFLTANVAAFLVSQGEGASLEDIDRKLDSLEREVQLLRRELSSSSRARQTDTIAPSDTGVPSRTSNP
jgi:voltage-gated potassium channel